jgi:hypothetical protein
LLAIGGGAGASCLLASAPISAGLHDLPKRAQGPYRGRGMSFQTEAKAGGMQPRQLCRAPGEDRERERTGAERFYQFWSIFWSPLIQHLRDIFFSWNDSAPRATKQLKERVGSGPLRSFFHPNTTLERLKYLDDHDLRKCCITFAKTFSHDDSSDGDLNDFISELQVLQVTLPDDLMSSLKILQFIIVADCYPNVSIVYQILLTIHVTVASVERSFSKLKLLKQLFEVNYVAEKVNGLAFY